MSGGGGEDSVLICSPCPYSCFRGVSVGVSKRT